MKLNEVSGNSSKIEKMIKYLEPHFDDVEEDSNNQIAFVNRTNAKANFGILLQIGGKWDVVVQGVDEDIVIEKNCTPARVVEIAKSVDKKWFKENDPDYE